MEIDDVDYLDDLLRGMQNKVGATIPLCLLQPILSGSSSDSHMGVNGSSTPTESGERRQMKPTVVDSTENMSSDGGNGHSDNAQIPVSTLQDLSPIKPFSSRFQRLEDKCQKLKNDMSVLRAMDVGVMKQFMTIYDAVEELHWMIESMGDSCESLSSSVYESLEQIHEKWMTERRQWKSTSSRDLSTAWRDDSRVSINHVGRLNSMDSWRQAHSDNRNPRYHGLSLQNINWQSPQKDLNNSFPQITSGRSNFERQRRSSVDHLPITPTATESPQSSPIRPRKRRSSSGALELEVGVVEGDIEEEILEKPAADQRNIHVKKPKFLFHSQSSPSFDPQEQPVDVTDTAVI
ncbi:uncharacterized protein LOC110977810 [Acanthaster planci]|uniref:Uncharacterized protein LOC110977810 n=1 Tax=Acanthaster planci TaxID=133434 RepID=A0A8B7Y441_ACAPL|nr:uncharacterized protein LOC110977810 [Acanthaster planci]